MYLYFDKQGILREFINDNSIRQNSAEVDTIYAYFESEVVTSNVSNFVAVDGVLQVGSSTQALTGFTLATGTIPYDPNRDLKYFKDSVIYRFYKYTLTAENLQNAGLALVTITAWTQLTPTPIYAAQGMVTFQIQNSVVMQNTPLSQTDLTYLLGVLASKENAVNKVTGFTGATNNEKFPTTQAVADYVESQREIIYITTANTFSEVEQIISLGKTPVLKINSSGVNYYECLIYNSASIYRFVRIDQNNMVHWHQLTSSGWTNGSYNVLDTRKVVITSSSGTLSQDDYNLLANYEDTLLIQKRADNDWVYFFRASDTNLSSLVYWSARIVLAQTSGVVTIGQYLFSVNNSTKVYGVSLTTQTTYSKSQTDTLLSAITNNYLISASASGDTLTLNGKSNGNNATTTFDISHKLDKNFSGVSYSEATTLGQSDYFVINVGGIPKKVSFQTIFTELGLGTVSHFLGTYSSLSALQTAHPTAGAGDYAYITEVDKDDTIITMAIWDSTDNEWQVQDLSQYVLESVFQAYQLTVTAAINGKSTVTLVEWS